MRCGKVFCPDRHFLVGPHLNVANPIGIWSKTIRHDAPRDHPAGTRQPPIQFGAEDPNGDLYEPTAAGVSQIAIRGASDKDIEELETGTTAFLFCGSWTYPKYARCCYSFDAQQRLTDQSDSREP